MAASTAPVRVASNFRERYPTGDPKATECVINLVRTENLLVARLAKRLRRFGLTPATFNVLMVIEGSREALCPSEIGERLLVTRGTITGLLDSLERLGYAERLPLPEDRRMVHVELTQKGLDALNALLPEHFQLEKDMLAGLTAQEKETLVGLLGKIQRRIE